MPTSSAIGGLFWSYNSPGTFVWAFVLSSGRIHVRADYKFVMTPIEDVASAITAKTRDIGITRLSSIFADPEMFPKTTGKRTRIIEAETPSQTFARFGLPIVAAGSNREHGWQRVHEYLRVAPDGKPWMVLDPDCTTLIRTVPTLVQTTNNPNDCEGDEYAAKALMFMLSARPSPSSLTPKRQPFAWGTVGWLKGLDTVKRGVLAR